MSGDVKIEIHKFHCYKNSNFLNDINVDNIFISKEIYSGKKKYVIGYTDQHKTIQYDCSRNKCMCKKLWW